MPRKEVLRLRSLVLRGSAAHSTSHSTRGDDPGVARVLRLPDELAWKVLGFWRATSDIGEVCAKTTPRTCANENQPCGLSPAS